MRESGYYPAGAEFDPRAPWNREDPPECEFNVAVSCSLSRDATVVSDDYDGGEKDEDGNWIPYPLNNPNDAYNNQFKSIEEIIDFAEKAAQKFLKDKDYSVKPSYALKNIIESCKGWTVDEENVEQV